MIYIAEIHFRNYLCYRGEHTLTLEPRAYALFAEDELDAESSNGIGKTAIVEAPVLAAFGKHNRERDDDLITRGEAGFEVKLTMSDGAWIQRRKARGKSMQIHASLGGSDVLAGQDAEDAFLKHLGVDYEDFRYTSWFEQRQTARIVLADPVPRMRMVSAWLGLEKLEAAHAHIADAAGNWTSTITTARDNLKRLIAARDEDKRVVEHGGPSDVDLANLRAAVVDATVKLEEGAKAEAMQARAAQFRAVVDEGMALTREAEARGDDVPTLEVDLEAARAARLAASEQLGRHRLTLESATRAATSFDGMCPILRATCPAREVVAASTDLTKKALDAARTEFSTANEVAILAQKEENKANVTCGEARRRADRIATLREKAEALRTPTHVATAEPVADLRAKLNEVRGRLSERESTRKSHDAAVERVKETDAKILALETEIVTFERKRDASLAASQVLGRNGAQKVLAIGALAEISAGANAALEETGIKLRVEFTWGSEGNEPAKHCQKCGSPFPSSTRVKFCERCNEPRGLHVKPRLDIALSDRSGALEDLAGITVQLSAAAWLRRDRAFAWGTALLDEPFGALDARNRRALSSHLAALLAGRYGFAQAIVVAHQRSALEAFPGRIVVRRLVSGDRTVAVE